jgi:hypothetical protein
VFEDGNILSNNRLVVVKRLNLLWTHEMFLQESLSHEDLVNEAVVETLPENIT